MDTNHQISFEFSLPNPAVLATPLVFHTPSQTEKTKPNRQQIVVNAVRLGNLGDISNAYSADRIDNGKVRKPFRYNGQLYTTTSTTSGIYVYDLSLRRAEAYRLLRATFFDGQITDIHTKMDHDNGASARADPAGFYHGIAVTYQGQQHVLTGPPLTFIPNIPGT